jgi:hypothetical protein
MTSRLGVLFAVICTVSAVQAACADDTESSESSTSDSDGPDSFAEVFPNCAAYMKSASPEDLASCAEQFVPACEALDTQKECDEFMQLDGTFDPAGVIILCTWTDHYVVGSDDPMMCSEEVSSRCLASRSPGMGGPSCVDGEWDNYRRLDDARTATVDVSCGMLPMNYTSCFSAERPPACDCPYQ